jgi:hypothetical protein
MFAYDEEQAGVVSSAQKVTTLLNHCRLAERETDRRNCRKVSKKKNYR